MDRRRIGGRVAMAALLALTSACFNESSCFNQSTTVTGPSQSQGGPSPGPSASPSGVPGSFDSVVLEIFGRTASCPAGETDMKPGCSIDMTATPKKGNVKVGPEVHGSSCRWFLNGVEVAGELDTATVKVTVSDAQPFNVRLDAKAAGTFTIRAQVLDVESAGKTFTVTAGP